MIETTLVGSSFLFNPSPANARKTLDSGDGDRLLTPREICRAAVPGRRPLGIATVFRWMTSGTRGVVLRSQLIGGRRFVRQSDLDRFLNDINRPASCEVA